MNTNTPTVSHASFPYLQHVSSAQKNDRDVITCWRTHTHTHTYIFAYRHQRGVESCQSCEHQPVCLAG